jgi:hypothetical protein
VDRWPKEFTGQAQGMQHRHNHYVPLHMIKRWEREHNGVKGVFVYLRAENQKKFWRRNKRKPYNFAVSDDLYVPSIHGDRNVAMEAGWLNEMETTLARLVAQVSTGHNELVIRNNEELAKLSMALFSLEHRSRFDLEIIKRAIEDDPSLREIIISANPEREVH